MGISIQFLGAAGTVTGSKYLLDTGRQQALIDCGLFQGSSQLDEQNWAPFPIPHKDIDAVFITHAHIDHTGCLPRLVKEGYRGPVYASAASCALMDLVLPDSARLQEQDAAYANKEGYSHHQPALPLYTEQDAVEVIARLHPVDFHKPLSIRDYTTTWRPAGHILGSAILEVQANADGAGDQNSLKIVFSGDLGRYGQEVMKPPYRIETADVLVIESTYGDRLHTEDSVDDTLERIIRDVMSKRGVLLIPAFAVGRTQIVLYHLRKLQDQGRIPNLPVYVDSPMAVDASQIYHDFSEDHNLDANLLEDNDRCPLRTKDTRYVREVEQSKKLNTQPGPAVILSASGMCTGGRVLHHLKWRLPDARNTVLLVGYQAEGTRGRQLEEGAKEVKIHGERVPVRARIESIDALSSHADQKELLRWMGGFTSAPRQIFIVHGEPAASRRLQDVIWSELGWKAAIAGQGEKVEIKG